MFKQVANYFNKKGLKEQKYSFLFEPYSGNEYVCFDCETTGLDVKSDDIISIGAVIIKDNKILLSKKFEVFIKTKKSLSSQNIKIHHIRECDLNKAIEIDDAIEQFLYFIKNRPLVGYYLEFDVAMVNRYLKEKLGIKLPNRQIEVSSLYYDMMIKKYPDGVIDLSFETILKKLDLPILKKHNAINDATMSAMMFLKLK